MCEIMERWKKELIADGQKTAFENGEKSSTIRIFKDFGKSQTETIAYLTQKLHLTQEEAKEAIEQYW